MKLAASDDFALPHIDWLCKECGMVYCYAGYPPETRCTDGHGAGWRPHPDQVEEYIDVLESLEPGDWVVLCGHGPAALKGPVASVSENQIRTEPVNSPGRVVWWTEGNEDTAPSIEWAKADTDHDVVGSDLYHVEAIDAEAIPEEPDVATDVRMSGVEIVSDAAAHVGIDPETVEVEDVRWIDGELEFSLAGERA